jgi:hypothetical protein
MKSKSYDRLSESESISAQQSGMSDFDINDWQTTLHFTQYDEESILKIAKYVDLRVLLKTKELTLALIYELYLDPESDSKYEKSSEEKCIGINEIAHYQEFTKGQIEEYVKNKIT